MNKQIKAEPLSPPKWAFLNELCRPLHEKQIRWLRQTSRRGEVSLQEGFYINNRFLDPVQRLLTAFDDFKQFSATAGIKLDGAYPLRIERGSMPIAEAYRITVDRKGAVLSAADTEGVRRGLVEIEDVMLGRHGPFLPLGVIERRPVIRTRISRHYDLFKPMGLDHFPDAYLNRLTHDGVNGLWHSCAYDSGLENLCSTSAIPEYGKGGKARLEYFRRISERYIRYGIKLYLLFIEPRYFSPNSPIVAAHPRLAGDLLGNGSRAFCTSTHEGQAYLEEAMQVLFSAVPLLGGIINISVGERRTHCYSMAPQTNCPRCAQCKPREVLADTMAAMARGAHAANHGAEIISWPYSQYVTWGEALTRDAAGHVPKGVHLMHNFESAGREKQLGKWRRADDYWLSYVGPSELYADCARRAVRHGTRMFAKIQVGCSHEVASVPHVPVPGNLFKKYAAMHSLGISGVMQCWGSGDYPSLMTRAAGWLAFAPFPRREADFLIKLARRDWGRDAARVVAVWKMFQKAYRHYPLTTELGYYGPMHDGPVWPLYLIPRETNLPPSWEIVPTSGYGDRIGECTGYHTLQEVIILCTLMTRLWQRGLKMLNKLAAKWRHDQERMHDIQTARALGLQFQSGLNILNFYALREKLAWRHGSGGLDLLQCMRLLVRDELAISQKLLRLAKAYPRLGFNSEAGGYKYYLAKIRWRMVQLEIMLREEFPRVAKLIRNKKTLFPAYTGEEPATRAYRCQKMAVTRDIPSWNQLALAPTAGDFTRWGDRGVVRNQTEWKAAYDQTNLYVAIRCHESCMAKLRMAIADKVTVGLDDCIRFWIQADQFQPLRLFEVNPKGARWANQSRGMNAIDPNGQNPRLYQWRTIARRENKAWSVTLAIPFRTLGVRPPPATRYLRINVGRKQGPMDRRELSCWAPSRKGAADSNPGDFGWLFFE